jgi:hypothetical protein
MSILLMTPVAAMTPPPWTASSMAIVEHLAEQVAQAGTACDMSHERRFLCEQARAALLHSREAALITVPASDDLDSMSAPPPRVVKRLVGRVVHVERPKAPCVEDEGDT